MNVLRRMAGSMGSWLLARAGKRLTTGGEWPGGGGGGFLDQWGTLRRPTSAALVREYESTVFACVQINAQCVAATPYRLLVSTRAGDKAPRQRTRPVSRKVLDGLRQKKHLAAWLGKAVVIEEVETHPLLDLLDYRLLLEMGIYLETVGQAPWLIRGPGAGPLKGTPTRLVTLPAHQIEVKKGESLDEPVAGFKWGNEHFTTEEIVWHHFFSPRDPFCGFTSPAKASWENLGLVDKQISKLHSSLDNDSIPSVLISPEGGDPVSMDGGTLGPKEAKALEARLIQKFRHSGGKLAVATTRLRADVLNVTPRDQQLADFNRIAHEATARNFTVPLAMLTTNTNLANLEAAQHQHAEQAIEPRCKLVDETVNGQLIPHFDPTGRLKLVHDSPVPEDADARRKERESLLKSGRTLNEILEAEGEEPIDGPEGDVRFVPTSVRELTVVDMAPAKPAPPAALESPQTPPDDERDTEPPDAEEAEKQAKAAAREAEKTAARETRERRETEAARLKVIFIALVDYWTEGARGWTRIGTVSAERLEPEPIIDEDWLDHVREHHGSKAAVLCRGGERCAAATAKGWDAATDTAAEGHERNLPSGAKLTRILRTMFAEQERAVFRQLGLKLFGGAATKEISEQLLANLNPNIDLTVWNDELAEDARPVLMIEAEKGARDVDIRLGATDVEAVWRVQLPEVEEAVREWTFKFAESTNATTSERINVAITRLRNELTAGILDGDNTLAELTKRVHSVFTGASKYRAKVIAATEASRAVHAGQAIAARQSGMVAGFIWLASSDACPMCLSVAAEHPDGVALGEPFADDGGTTDYSLTMYPPLHPWCACTVTEKLKPLGEVAAGEGWGQTEETES